MIFTSHDYDLLHSLVFQLGYPGYRPGLTEIPNGDGKADREKRFAHIAPKYLRGYDGPGLRLLWTAYREAFDVAKDWAEDLNVPADFAPDFDACALRILDYPPGAGSAEHSDFDLFTINAYRNVPNPGLPEGEIHIGQIGELVGLGRATMHHVVGTPEPQQAIVFFVLPAHGAVLPDGRRVGPQTEPGTWLHWRMTQSRTHA